MSTSNPLLAQLQETWPHIPVIDVLQQGLHGKHLLITGGSGFFGRWLLALLDALNSSGSEVRVSVVSRDPQRFLTLNPWFAEANWLHWHRHDIRQLPSDAVGAVDLVVHAATDTSVAAGAKPLQLFDTIIEGARRILDAAQCGGARRILFTGSGAQYGSLAFGVPVPEDSQQACDSRLPASAYGEAKRAQETLAAIHGRASAIDMIYTRCFAFSGAGLPLDAHFAIGNFVRDALQRDAIYLSSGGQSVRSYLHGADLAVWLLFLLLRGVPGEAYNVGSDEALSIRDLAARVRDQLAPGKPLAFPNGHGGPTSYYVPDISKARALGLDTWTSLDASVQGMARYGACNTQ